MIEGKHFRSVEARRRTLAEAIDRYIAEELPKKRAGDMHRHNLPWWRKHLGHLNLADITPAILVEHRGKLARETYIRAKPQSKRTTLQKGEQPRQLTRARRPSTGTWPGLATCLPSRAASGTGCRTIPFWGSGVSARALVGRASCRSPNATGFSLRRPRTTCFIPSSYWRYSRPLARANYAPSRGRHRLKGRPAAAANDEECATADRVGPWKGASAADRARRGPPARR